MNRFNFEFFWIFIVWIAATGQENDAQNHINKNGKPFILTLNLDQEVKKYTCQI